jgi:hypothetical protein
MIDPNSTVGAAVVGTDTVVAGIMPVHYAAGFALIDGVVVAVPAQTVSLPVGASSTIVMPSGEIIVEFGTVADQPGQIVLDSFTVLDPSSSVVGSAVVGTAPVVGIIGWWPRGTLGAVAQVNIQNQAVGNSQLQDGAVGTVALSNGAVTTPILANAAVVAAKLASQAVTNAAIASQAIGAGQIMGFPGESVSTSVGDPSTNTIAYPLMNTGVQDGVGAVGQLNNGTIQQGTTSGLTGAWSTSNQVVVAGTLLINVPAGGTWTITLNWTANIQWLNQISLTQSGGTTLASQSGLLVQPPSTTTQNQATASISIAAAGGSPVTISFNAEGPVNSFASAELFAGSYQGSYFRTSS